MICRLNIVEKETVTGAFLWQFFLSGGRNAAMTRVSIFNQPNRLLYA